MKRFTNEEYKYIQQHYIDKTITNIAKDLGRHLGSVAGRMRFLGLSIPAHIIAERKRIPPKVRKGCFKKGDIPYNKGKKMDPKTYSKCRKTMFQPGHEPHNTKHNGAVSIRKDHKGILYKHIRIEKGKWEPLHRKVWEDAYGPIPEGMIIVFKDKNQFNCDIENLEMISKEENMIRNSIMRYPEGLRTAIKRVRKIEKLTNKKQ